MLNFRQFIKESKIVNSDEFKKWFKDSKITDSNGNPLKVFHGTDKHFDDFNVTMDGGFHFGDKYTAAFIIGDVSFSGENGHGKETMVIIPAYLSIKNPLHLNYDPISPEKWKPIITNAKSNGYDGIIYPNEIEGNGESSFVVFNKSQIWKLNIRGIY